MSVATAELSSPASPSRAKIDPVHEAVSTAIESSPYIAGGDVRVEAGEGRVRLHGHVGTFFEKQMAQEVVRRLDGVERVENLLQVAWS